MKYLFLAAALLFLVILTVGGLSGRIRASRGCCAPADPQRDLRMRE